MKLLMTVILFCIGFHWAHAENSQLMAFHCDGGEMSALNKFYGEGLVELDGDGQTARGSFILSTRAAGFDSQPENLGAQEFTGQYSIIPAGSITANELIAIEGFFGGDKNKYFKIILDFKDNYPSRILFNGTQFRSVCLTK